MPTPGPDGLTVVDKSGGMTSHDVVARMRRLAGTRKVGHAGTLDPMATGVLILGLGRGTRLLGHLAGRDKTYLATIRLGISTVTDDAEGAVLEAVDASGVSASALTTGIAALTGDIEQTPSAVSAIKVDGRRAYARVRAGEQVQLAARPVTVRRFELLALQRPEQPGGLLDLDVEVTCTTGTYIRALARDLGAGLGVGGHLTALRRTRVGGFDLGGARTLAELEEHPVTHDLAAAVRLGFAVRTVDEDMARALTLGQQVAALGGPASGPAGPAVEEPEAGAVQVERDGYAEGCVYAVLGPDGEVVALVEDRDGRTRIVAGLAAAAG